MSPSGHIAASVLIAPLAANPVGALLLGVLQHALLDRAASEHRLNWTSRDELRRNVRFIVLECALVLLALWIAWRAGPLAWWSVIGYFVTELPDAYRSLHDPGLWMRGEHLVWWHRPLRGKPPPDWPPGLTLIISAVLLGASYLSA